MSMFTYRLSQTQTKIAKLKLELNILKEKEKDIKAAIKEEVAAIKLKK